MRLVLFALEREAAPFRRAARGLVDVRIAVTGIGSRAAGATVTAEIAAAPPALVMMAGFGGGLRDGLAVGDVVVPAEVIDDTGQRWACSPTPSAGGRLLTTKRIVATPHEKRRLGREHAADSVDMESAAVASACADADIPFVAVRAISDTTETTLSADLVRLLAGGTVTPWRACRAAVRSPSLVREFFRLARDTRTAARNLSSALVALLTPSP